MPVLKFYNPVTRRWEPTGMPSQVVLDAPGAQVSLDSPAVSTVNVWSQIGFASVIRESGVQVSGDSFILPADGWYIADFTGTWEADAGGSVRGWNIAVDGASYDDGTGQPITTGLSAAFGVQKGLTFWGTKGQAVTFWVYNNSRTMYFYGRRASVIRLASGTPGPAGPPGTVSATSGIVFPATQVPSDDVHTLDDYEENSWTPSWYATGGGAAASVTAAGRYVKRGRWVKVSGSLQAMRGTLSGSLRIDGLPFAATSGAGLTWYAGSVGYYHGFIGANGSPGVYSDGSSRLVPVLIVSGGSTTFDQSFLQAAVNGHIIFTCEYEAAD